MGDPPEIIQATINKDGTEMAKMFDRVHYRFMGISEATTMLLSLPYKEPDKWNIIPKIFYPHLGKKLICMSHETLLI